MPYFVGVSELLDFERDNVIRILNGERIIVPLDWPPGKLKNT